MRIAFYTLGCKVNQYETQVLARLFAGAGYDVVHHEEPADVYVVNSCTVTAEGDRKTRQMLRRFRKQNPAAKVALTGCFPQAFPDAAARLPEADVIAGNRRRADLVDLVGRCLRTGERVVEIAPHEKGEPFERGDAGGAGERTRAFVKIEDGCERYCAYCIIPTARGPVRSKPPEELAAEVAALASAGYREVVLTGINLSCYGKDLGLRLADGVEAACKTAVERVRLGSLEPELLEPDDIAQMAAQEKLCPQFHMSLQSGCDATLRRMNRHYTAAEYAAIAGNLRRSFANCAITTDIMTGFPGETDEEFAQSLDFLRRMAFAKTHVFAYSRRPGTRADRMENQVDHHVKAQRARIMAQAAEESRRAYWKAQEGKVLRALFETRLGAFWEGYAENYVPVRVESGAKLHGQILPVRVTRAADGACLGELEECEAREAR